MDVVVIGISHQTAPVEFREKLDFSKHAKESYLSKLMEQQSVSSGLVLSTCNRVEVYAAGQSETALLNDAEKFLQQFHNVNPTEVRHFFYSKTNREAVKHLFRVASSLDSLVIGEPQILGQVKEAYFDARSMTPIDPFFERLVQKAFSVAKRVRTETKIAEQSVSVSHTAIELAEKIFGELSHCRVLMVGAGEMVEIASRSLVQRGVKRILFANRTYEHSVELAQSYGGLPILLPQMDEYLVEADMVFVSTSAPFYLITREKVEAVLSKGKQSPMFFIDISVPRNVDPSIHELEEIYLYNIDDLKGIVDANLQMRKEEAEKAETIIEAEVARFYQGVEKLEVAPLIRNLQDKYEVVLRQEMERIQSRFSGLTAQELLVLEKSISSAIRKVLNDPILFLKGEGNPRSSLERAELLRQIFRLDHKVKEEEDGSV